MNYFKRQYHLIKLAIKTMIAKRQIKKSNRDTMRITQKEYLEAKEIVDGYHRQLYAKTLHKKKAVMLSEYGKTMQKPHNKKGIIVNKRLAGVNDFTVEVCWENGKKEWMHESQVMYW